MNHQDKGHRRVRKYIHGPNFSGQHLLHNPKIIQEIIQRAGVTREDVVFDLGAGKGALTFPLGRVAGQVLAVENDPSYVAYLRKQIGGQSNIKIIEKDILEVKFPERPFYVVSNIPYSITTPIFDLLLNRRVNHLQSALIMIELGAAKRFTGAVVQDPRVIAWRTRYQMRIIKVVDRREFAPPPKVDSAVVEITPKKEPVVPLKHWGRYLAFLEYGMKRRRMPISQGLKEVFTPPQLRHIYRNLKIDGSMLLGELPVEKWGHLFNAMVQVVEAYRWPK